MSATTTKERLMKLETELEYIKHQVEDIHEAIMGNGKKGVKEELAEIRGGLRVARWIAGVGGGSGAMSTMFILVTRFFGG